MNIKCEKCNSSIEIVTPSQWKREQYATCQKCGHKNNRASVVKQLRLTTASTRPAK